MPDKHLKNCGGTPRTCPYCLNRFIDSNQASIVQTTYDSYEKRIVQTFCSEDCGNNFHEGLPRPVKDVRWIK